MNRNISLLLSVLLLTVYVRGQKSAIDVIQDVYKSCLQEFRFSCVKPKALQWINENSGRDFVKITDDLSIKRRLIDSENEIDTGVEKDILDKFEDFLQSHELVAKAPGLLRPNGPLGQYIPRTFEAKDISVPLAATGRSSKLVKRVIFPFLLGLKFKTAVIVPLALALIALKTWKALTLGLLSLVLTGAIAVFSKLMGPKAPAYEVLHYQPHVSYPHVDVLPAPAVPVPVASPVYYKRSLDAQELAYNYYLK